MYDATYRATREFVIAQMDQGATWQDATDRAPLAISRATAYRIWLRSWREGPAVLDDGRHGHPWKLDPRICDWLIETCTAAPSTPSHLLQPLIGQQFGVDLSVRHINRVRLRLGVPRLRPSAPKKDDHHPPA